MESIMTMGTTIPGRTVTTPGDVAASLPRQRSASAVSTPHPVTADHGRLRTVLYQLLQARDDVPAAAGTTTARR